MIGGGVPDSGLSRRLTVWSAVGVSIALMAPSMAININPQATSEVAGRAVPIAFLLATVGVLLIAHTFVRLSQRFSHSGSVYAFVGVTLGPRSGVVAGWLNACTYVLFGVVTSTAAGMFLTDLARKVMAPNDVPDWMAFPLAWLVLIAMWALATRDVRGGTTVLLVTEGLTILLILVVAGVTLVKLITGTAGHRIDPAVFSIESGTSVSNLFLGVVFGFLSFAGFEAAATLGEETAHPHRDIPRAILATAVLGGVFFVAVTAIAMMAFGTDGAGVAAFTKSQALIGDLAQHYVAAWVADLIVIGAAFSAAACCLASLVGASRLIFALSRDGMGPAVLATVHPVRAVPHIAATACALTVAVVELFGWSVRHARPFDVFTIAGAAGTLILLIAYAMACLGALRLFFLTEGAALSRWEVVIPVLGLALLGYTVFRNLVPWPMGTSQWGPGIAIAVVGAVVTAAVARPTAARSAGTRLLAQSGLQADR
ncbi:MAG: APC family permease [Mycobacterium sp.]